MESKRQSFLNYLKFERQYSKHTIDAYRRDLEDFFFFLKSREINDLDALSTTDIRSWMVELVEKGWSNKTIHRKIAALRSFFKFLNKKGWGDDIIMEGVVLPKVKRRLPEYVEHAPMDRLLDPSAYGQHFEGIRDFFIIHLLYFTGIRRAELMDLGVDSFDSTRKILKVMGKGRKERIIPIGKVTLELLSRYIAIRKTTFSTIPIEEAFWLTAKGGKIYAKLVYGLVTKHLKRSGHFGKGSPHVLRHTFATHLSNEGADLNAIKELLGHAGLAATQVYTHNSIKRLQEVYEKSHPKAE